METVERMRQVMVGCLGLTEKLCHCKEVHLRRNYVPVLTFVTDGLQVLTVHANNRVASVNRLTTLQKVLQLFKLSAGKI
jgi:hypothetical protein